MMKRKDGDHLGINGVYALREEPHNDSPCWVQQPWEGRVEVWHIFRSRDRASWVIDSLLHGAGRDDAVAARLTADVEDPTAATASWVPMPSLKLAPITPASFDCLARGPGGYLGGSVTSVSPRTQQEAEKRLRLQAKAVRLMFVDVRLAWLRVRAACLLYTGFVDQPWLSSVAGSTPQIRGGGRR
ncbi:unnamed protein product [Symbiodinium sp. CCMP2456]|nr:unnamed protein product [Symbiodinium sp. CCMP2456]